MNHEKEAPAAYTPAELMVTAAAREIADVVLRGLEPHPVLKRVIKEAEETVTRVRVSKSSPLVGKNLREAQIEEETGMWVLVIRRGQKWLRPRSITVIKAGDVLVASGYTEGEEEFRKLAYGIHAPSGEEGDGRI